MKYIMKKIVSERVTSAFCFFIVYFNKQVFVFHKTLYESKNAKITKVKFY